MPSGVGDSSPNTGRNTAGLLGVVNPKDTFSECSEPNPSVR